MLNCSGESGDGEPGDHQRACCKPTIMVLAVFVAVVITGQIAGDGRSDCLRGANS
jgi:hypothetical protein